MRLKWLIPFLFAMALAGAAHAQLPCAAYPFTFSNNTVADANQVNSNFSTIRNCVNSLSPLGTPITGSGSNVHATLAAAGASVTVSADQIQVSTTLSGATYRLSSYSQTLNTGTTGAGGMDTGSLPSSSNIGIYAIYNPTGATASILGWACGTSCATIYGGANMPAGYTASGLLAIWPTNSTPNLVAGVMQEPLGNFPCAPVVTVLTSGSGTYTTPTGTAGCSGRTALYLEIRMAGGGAGGVAAPATNAPTDGADTTFGSLTAGKGLISADNSAGGLGGTASGGDVNWTGGAAEGSGVGSATVTKPGGSGGCPVLFGGGAGTGQGATNGGSASANSGCGGAGGGSDAVNTTGRPGGGGGGSLMKTLSPPAATYSYSVGAGGAAGTSANQNGGAGAAGIIIVTARWN